MSKEWFVNTHPKINDEGFKIFYKAPISTGKHKGRISKWKGSGSVMIKRSDALSKGEEFKQFFPRVMIRKVRFTKTRIYPIGKPEEVE